MFLFALTIFLSAFLLFQLQPVIAKIILPWFGGGSSVWSTCMLFFQAVLLLGYLYAHWLHEKLSARKQAVVHSLLLAAGLAALPITPAASWRGAGLENPSWQILKLLAATAGLPYFLLSATTPLLQAWYARTHARAMPYRLYALSNLASLLALVTYPVLFEPNFSLRNQARLWSGVYLCFTLLCAAAAWRSLRSAGPAHAAPSSTADPASRTPHWGTRLLWVALAACASILFLSTTSYLTQDVAAMPFLWILPLSIYLLSFIICFETPRLYWRPVCMPLLLVALGAVYYALYWRESSLMVLPAIALCGGALFIFCMFCHGELARAKPAPRHLTIFYVMVSLGGALGGLLVGIIAPNFFNAPYEFPAGLLLCACLAAVVLLKDKIGFLLTGWGRAAGVVASAILCVYALSLARGVHELISDCRVVARNFYGQLRVYDVDQGDGTGVHRKLLHGVINHGEQILSEEYRRQPATYYCPGTGIGDVLASAREGVPRRIGILGLGCGTLTAYGRKGDVIRLYEINPLVVELARTEFTYLNDTPAHIETVLGDGRLSLEREPGQGFDILIMDAFSGDSVPVHLITKEAFQTYLRHLKPDGILAVNISNKYLALGPVMERAARYYGKVALLFEFTAEEDDHLCFSASWVLIMDPKAREAFAGVLGAGRMLESRPGFRMWTDDYSGMFGILK
jgi:hypothetical protein